MRAKSHYHKSPLVYHQPVYTCNLSYFLTFTFNFTLFFNISHFHFHLQDYYHKDKCTKYGIHCKKSWRDPLGRSIPAGFTFGGFVRNYMKYESKVIPVAEGESSRACSDGYEGNVDSNLRFTSCHLKIYVPEWWERDSIILIAVSGVLFFLGSVGYVVLRRKLKQRFLLAKAERRRSRKSSENNDNAGAFGHK